MRDGEELATYSKKMQSALSREYRKMYRNLNGIRTMNRLPECLVVIDPRKEKNAVGEARKLGITTVALIDTDCDPDEVDLPIPGNDDSIRSIELIVQLLADAVLAGKTAAGEVKQEQAERQGECRTAWPRSTDGASHRQPHSSGDRAREPICRHGVDDGPSRNLRRDHGSYSDGRDYRSGRQGAARADRPAHDGLQTGLARDRRRRRTGRRVAAQAGQEGGREAGRPLDHLRPDRRLRRLAGGRRGDGRSALRKRPVANNEQFVALANDLAKQLATGPGAADARRAAGAAFAQPGRPDARRSSSKTCNNRIREAFKLERIVRIDGTVRRLCPPQRRRRRAA